MNGNLPLSLEFVQARARTVVTHHGREKNRNRRQLLKTRETSIPAKSVSPVGSSAPFSQVQMQPERQSVRSPATSRTPAFERSLSPFQKDGDCQVQTSSGRVSRRPTLRLN